MEDRDDVRWVTLDRPETHNAFNEVVISEITQVFQDIKHQANTTQNVPHLQRSISPSLLLIKIHCWFVILVSCSGVDRQRQIIFSRSWSQLDEKDGLLHTRGERARFAPPVWHGQLDLLVPTASHRQNQWPCCRRRLWHGCSVWLCFLCMFLSFFLWPFC